MPIRLRWINNNLAEDGNRVFRSLSPMDPNDMPTPLATLPQGSTEYIDLSVQSGETYYYRVGAFAGQGQRLSEEISVVATEAPGNFPVLFVGASNTFSTDTTNTSAISGTIALPGVTLEGDLMLLHVMSRSAVSTPNGWTLLLGPTDAMPGDGLEQRQWMFYRMATTSDAGSEVVVTQAEDVRLSIHAQVFRPRADEFALVASGVTSIGASNTSADIPVLTALATGQMAVIAGTTAYNQGSQRVDIPEGYTLTTPNSFDGNRLACAFRTMDVGNVTGGRFEWPRLTSSNLEFTSAVAVIIGSEYN